MLDGRTYALITPLFYRTSSPSGPLPKKEGRNLKRKEGRKIGRKEGRKEQEGRKEGKERERKRSKERGKEGRILGRYG